MCYATKNSTDRAGKGLIVDCVGHLLAFDAILLGRKGERDVGCREQLTLGSKHHVMEATGTNLEFNIL